MKGDMGNTKCGQMGAFLNRARERGMTMPEMVVALLISTLVIFGVVNLYRFANNDWNDGLKIEQLQHETQTAMGFLERDVKQAAVTTQQPPLTTFLAPMITTDNGYGLSSYGVIIIEDIGTSGLATYEQVDYRLTTWQNGQLQRFDVGTYSGSIQSPFPSNQLTTLLDNVSLPTVTPAPFTISTCDVNSLSTYDITSVSAYPHPSLTIATLTIQKPNAAGTTRSGAIVQLQTQLTMRGDVNAQIQALQEGDQ